MPVTNVKTNWVDGNLVFYDKSGNEIATFDGANRQMSFPAIGILTLPAGEIDTGDIAAGAVTEVKLAAASTDGLHPVRVARATYDFAADGGAIGAIDSGVTIPAKAVILDGVVDVVTTCTTAGADAGTMAISVEGAGDIVAAIAVSNAGNPWDAGRHDVIPVGSAATAVKTTQARNVTFTIAGQAFTAGKLVVFLRYVVSE